MGIKVEKNEQPELYESIFLYVKEIIKASEVISKIEMKKSDPHSEEKIAQASKTEIPKKQTSVPPKEIGGYCIRCHAQMELNPDKPLCSKCYPIWADFGDVTYPEKFCHVCGKASKQSYEKPVCYNCYKKLYK